MALFSYGQSSARAQDTFIASLGNQENNNESENINEVRNTSGGINHRPLLRFASADINPDIAGEYISTASLNVWARFGNIDHTLYIYRVRPGRPWVSTEVTWNEYASGSNWTDSGAASTATDIYPTLVATVKADSLGTDGVWTIDVRDDVQAWADGEVNNGWLILSTVPGTDSGATQLWAEDWGNSATRPQLSINTGIAPGTEYADTLNFAYGAEDTTTETLNISFKGALTTSARLGWHTDEYSGASGTNAGDGWKVSYFVTAPKAGTIVSAGVRAHSQPASGAGTDDIQMAIYDGNSGDPVNLMGVTDIITMPDDDSYRNHEATITTAPNPRFEAGDVLWITIYGNNLNGDCRFTRASGADTQTRKFNTGDTAPIDDPYGIVSDSSVETPGMMWVNVLYDGEVANNTLNISFSGEAGGGDLASTINISFGAEDTQNSTLNLSFSAGVSDSSTLGVSFSSEDTSNSTILISFSSGDTSNSTLALSFAGALTSNDTLNVSFSSEDTLNNTLNISFSSAINDPHADTLNLSFSAVDTSNDTLNISFGSSNTSDTTLGLSFAGALAYSDILNISFQSADIVNSTLNISFGSSINDPYTDTLNISFSGIGTSSTTLPISFTSETTQTTTLSISFASALSYANTLNLSFSAIGSESDTLNISFTGGATSSTTIGISFASALAYSDTLNISFNSQGTSNDTIGISFASESSENTTVNISFSGALTANSTLGISFSGVQFTSSSILHISFSVAGDVKSDFFRISFSAPIKGAIYEHIPKATIKPRVSKGSTITPLKKDYNEYRKS